MSAPNDDPWGDLLSNLGVDASAAAPPLPPVSAAPAVPRRVLAPPKPAAPPPAADWGALAENLGVKVTAHEPSQVRKPETQVQATVSVGGVEVVRAVRGPDDTEPPLTAGIRPRSGGERADDAEELESREERPRAERGSDDRGRRGDRGRGGRDRGGRDRGDRPRSEHSRGDQPRGEHGGRGRDDRGPRGARPAEISPEVLSEREPEAAAPETRGDQPRRAESRGSEGRGDSRRGGRDRGGRSRGPRDADRDSRRPQGQRDEARPPVSETPRPAESRRYRDDEDDDLDDLRAPIRSYDRPGEPTLDSSQAARKLWDDEDQSTTTSSFDVFGIIDEKIGGPPIIDRHDELEDDQPTAQARDDEDDADPREPRSEGDAEPRGDRPRRRRRRRGGRSGRRADGSSRSVPREVAREDDIPLEAELDSELRADLPPAAEGDDEAPRTGRRRRRRRSGRSRDDKSRGPATGDRAAALDETEDLAPIRSRDAHPHEEDDAEDHHHKHLHRDVTPWKEAIGFLVSANMENRSRSPRSSDRRGFRGGRERG